MTVEPYKDRVLREGHLVDVYRNLHRATLSIRDAETGLVLGHGTGFTLYGVSFHVSEAGRQRVLSEEHKNVHAFMRGNLELGIDQTIDTNGFVYYNPYKTVEFVDHQTRTRIPDGSIVFCHDEKRIEYLRGMVDGLQHGRVPQGA